MAYNEGLLNVFSGYFFLHIYGIQRVSLLLLPKSKFFNNLTITIKEIENMYHVFIELWGHEWKFGGTRNAVRT